MNLVGVVVGVGAEERKIQIPRGSAGAAGRTIIPSAGPKAVNSICVCTTGQLQQSPSSPQSLLFQSNCRISLCVSGHCRFSLSNISCG